MNKEHKNMSDSDFSQASERLGKRLAGNLSGESNADMLPVVTHSVNHPKGRSMSKSAKERFDETMQRCDNLLKLAETASPRDELLRFVVVLCVSAFDMYASDRFMENFARHIRKRDLSPDEIELLKKSGVTIEVVLNLLKQNRKGKQPFRAISGYVDKYFAKASRQSFAKINDLYAYYGLPKLADNVLKKCDRKTIGGKIQKMLNRRHKIVHEADYDGKHKLTAIVPREVYAWRQATESFVGHMEEILCNRFNAKSQKKRVGKKGKKACGG